MDSSSTVHEKSISTFGRVAFPKTSFRPEPPPSPPGSPPPPPPPGPVGSQRCAPDEPGEVGVGCDDSSSDESEDDGSEPGSPGPPAFALAFGDTWSLNKLDDMLGAGPACQLPGKGGTGPRKAASRLSPSSPNDGDTGEPHRAQKAAFDDKEYPHFSQKRLPGKTSWPLLPATEFLFLKFGSVPFWSK